ncbi:MAG: ammonium transporter [Balneolaceae bacterium]
MKLRLGIMLTAVVVLMGTSAFDFTEANSGVAVSAEITNTTVIQTDGGDYSSMEEFEASTDYIKFIIDNLWILIAAFMVLLMHLGFATVESGLTQAKNAVNVIYKNVFILCTGILIYAFIGFQIMYPGNFNGFFGFGGFGIGYDASDPIGMLTPAYGLNMTIWTDFIFQAMFAATAATIVSGCVTGRIKLSSFMLFGVLLLAFSYPVTGSWMWGGGWLADLGFYDFAGSTLVHGVGGTAGLACVILLGARSGKYKDGKIHGIPAHNIPLATVGVFLLFLGWFGFNGGSVLSADPVMVSYVFVTTALAACAGALASMITTQVVMKSLDAPMALNGILAGLVGITAGADAVTLVDAVAIGAVAGVLVVLSILMFDKLKIDDPVGAISVHGVCGIWGTLAVGIFSANANFWVQLLGTFSIIAFTFVFSITAFAAIKATMGVRVSNEVESDGLDISEHGNHAYPDFSPVKTSELGAFADY